MIKSRTKKSKMEIIDAALKIAIGVILLVYSFSLLVPIFWMLINSVKGLVDYTNHGSFSLPTKIDWSNFKRIPEILVVRGVRTPDGVGTMEWTLSWMFIYSFLWAFTSSIFYIMIQTMCAYVIAKYKFPGRDFIYSLGIIVMIVPIVGTAGSAMLLRKQFGIYNNITLMILTSPYTAFSGLNFLIQYAAYKGIPWEYAEAVFIDGGGHLRVFTTIMLPMVLPTIWVLTLLGFIGAWNDYSVFLMWLPSYKNLAIGIYNVQYNLSADLDGKGSGSIPQLLACFTVVSLPVVILYISFQKIITANFIVGGLKG